MLLDRVRMLLRVDTAAVLLLDRQGSNLVVRATRGLDDAVEPGFRIAVGKGFAGQVAALRRAVVLDEVSPSVLVNPSLWRRGMSTLLGVPLLDGGRLLGVVNVGAEHPRRFTDSDIGLLEQEASRIARLVHGQQVLNERMAARLVQDSLLPGQLPDVEGLEFASGFATAEEFGVGGDWFDVFKLPGGRVGVVIGDVAGFGLRAAIVMGRLRSALRAYALESETPGQALNRLFRKFAHFEPDEMATVLYITIAPDLGSFTWCSYGHPPPVMAVPGKEPLLLQCRPNPPIGSHLTTRELDIVSELPPGATVGCYTDGLVERRGESLDVGLERLRSAFFAGDPYEVRDSVMAEIVGTSSIRDDTALLVFRRTG